MNGVPAATWTITLIIIVLIILFVLAWLLILPQISTPRINCAPNELTALQTGWYGSCQLDADCAGNLICSSGVCKQPLGGPCWMLQDCAAPANYCRHVPEISTAGTCIQLPLGNFMGSCANNVPCPDGTLPSQDQWGNCTCLGALNAHCQRGEQCQSGNCNYGYCTAPAQLGDSCQIAANNCDTNLHCSQHVCQPLGIQTGQIGAYCDLRISCRQGSCQDNICTDQTQVYQWLESCALGKKKCGHNLKCLASICHLDLALKYHPEVSEGIWRWSLKTTDMQYLADFPVELKHQKLLRWQHLYVLTDQQLYYLWQINDRHVILAIPVTHITDICWDAASQQLYVCQRGNLYTLFFNANQPDAVTLFPHHREITDATQIDVYEGRILYLNSRRQLHISNNQGQLESTIYCTTLARWRGVNIIYVDDQMLLQQWPQQRRLGPYWYNLNGQYYNGAKLVELHVQSIQSNWIAVWQTAKEQYFLAYGTAEDYDTLPWLLPSRPVVKIEQDYAYVISHAAI